MDILDFLNKNPAILSIVAFPVGLLLLVGLGKLAGLGGLVKILKEHIEIQVKIESRLQEFVNEMKHLLAANWDNRRYLDEQFDYIKETLKHIIELIPKRRGE